MSTGTLPPVIERVRMAVSDCGYDPTEVDAAPGQDDNWMVPAWWPFDLRWRSREVAVAATLGPCCAECYGWADQVGGTRLKVSSLRRECEAPLPFTQDCGRDRSHP